MSTGIPYLDEVYNPITGCSGKGCKVRDNCWAKDMVKRFPHLHGIEEDSVPMWPISFDRIQFHPKRLDQPLHWKKPRRIGVCFLGDLLDIDVRADWIHAVLHRTEMARQHTFFFLTKQPEKIGNVIRNHWDTNGTRLTNCWWGVSICDQDDADRMIPELLKVPGKKWVSFEPMLGGPVSFFPWLPIRLYAPAKSGVTFGWVVLGCESGPRRRPCPHEWMIDVVRQCKAAGVPVYVKQVDMGGRVSRDPVEWPDELKVREMP